MNHEECLSFRDLLRYNDGGLETQVRARCEKHINACPSCQEELAYVRKLCSAVASRSGAQSKPGYGPPDDFFDLAEKFFGKCLSPDEKPRFYKYLLSNRDCFEEFISATCSDTAAITPAERAFLDLLKTTEVPDRLTIHEQEFFRMGRSKEEIPERNLAGLWPRLVVSLRLPKVLTNHPYASLSLVAAVVAIVALLPRLGSNQNTLVSGAIQNYLETINTLHVGEEELRPVSAANFSAVGVTRGGEQQESLRRERAKLFKAFEAQPNNAELSYRLGTICFFDGDVQQARTYYEKAIALNPELAEVYNDFALVDIDTADFESALEHLKTALRLKPSLAEARYNLAIVYQLKGDTPLAEIAAWKAYLALQQEQGSDWQRIANSRLKELRANN